MNSSKAHFKILVITCFCIAISFPSFGSPKKQEFFILDSWVSGFIAGLAKNKEERWKSAFKRANLNAKNDLRIWGGLFVTDSNSTNGKRFLELGSRFTYQGPQTGIGFFMSHFYNTVLCRVNTVSHPNGSTLLNMNVAWTGICFGNYILAKKASDPDPNNRIFQHEYGHYLQSKRMGMAYLVRVGLPAIMSTGIHDEHPVEVDCNREAFIYFNRIDPNFQNDSAFFDKKGWDFLYNPFPDTIGVKVVSGKTSFQYLNYKDSADLQKINLLKVKAKWLDYVGWFAFPAPLIIGVCNSSVYNENQEIEELKRKASH
ncbi:hypothetical protein [Fluviicola taffensis]|uniref:Secreted protein n=1 Tax=Fluviicola taffensis (strain DSM 16823 / NCIMB 13979 / RW262) TaxID=755732 RepID=F2IAA0_FLUTR|nr:hypothetical protein [Fluviicola taffensis]AEA42035.1 hypothetical protein Fluta_0025 [Fluviicola taffensis DSM 16823]